MTEGGAEDLDALSTEELHRRAIRLAERRLDVRFLWRLVEYIPEAAAIRDRTGESQADIMSATAWFIDLVRGGRDLHEALRPIYLEYLRAHQAG